MAALVVIYPDGPLVRREFPLPAHEVIVGRDKRCAVHIDSESLSRQHARIYFDGDAWIVEDLQSTNGCFINDMQVTKSVLHDSDMLKLGIFIFRFRAAGAFEIPEGTDEGEDGSGAPAVIGVPRPRSRN